MRRSLLTLLTSLLWLIASPSLQLRDSVWVEVGATPAAAQSAVDPATGVKKKPVKKVRRPVGSSGVVTSNQPGFYPMRPITSPSAPVATGTVITPARDPLYPNVPTVPAIVPETSQDRVVRCTHQGALGGLPPGQQGAYIHNCAF